MGRVHRSLIAVLCWVAPVFAGTQEAIVTGTEGDVPVVTVSYVVKSPWSVLRVKRSESASSFETWIESDVPLDGWLLVKKGVARPVGRESLNAVFRVHFLVPVARSEDMTLTLFPLVDGSPQPLIVPWRDPQTAKASMGEGILDPWMRWQSDPSRPFNHVVQGLFQSAVESYREGQREEALRQLDKASTLDPTHPQVLDLRQRVLGGSGTSSRPGKLREAKALLKKGDAAAAIELLDALLTLDAKDAEASALRKKAVAVFAGQEAPKVHRAKKKKKGKSTELPLEDPNAKSRADQAYNLGLECYRKGQREAAKTFFEQALQNDPHHLQARRALERLKAGQSGG